MTQPITLFQICLRKEPNHCRDSPLWKEGIDDPVPQWVDSKFRNSLEIFPAAKRITLNQRLLALNRNSFGHARVQPSRNITSWNLLLWQIIPNNCKESHFSSCQVFLAPTQEWKKPDLTMPHSSEFSTQVTSIKQLTGKH